MSIPLPGSGFAYSVFKDLWSWGSTLLRERRFAPDVFRGWTVDQWYEPVDAVSEFTNIDQDWLRVLESQNAKDEGREFDRTVDRAYGDLRAKLIRGELLARGYPEPHSAGTPYLAISRHEWRAINLDPAGSNRAEGGGASYMAVTIGKPGTKRLFRRGR